jgi:GT2 family glycosyltransferase
VLFRSAAFLIEKKIFNELGGFDENYFFYYEDTDFGWRLRSRGYKIILSPKAKVYHKYFFGRHPRKFYYAERNRIITLLKNYESKTLFLIMPSFLLTEAGVLFYFLLRDPFLSKLSGYYWIFRNMDKIMKARYSVQRTRKVTDKEIVKYFFGRIEFKEIKSYFIDYILNPIIDFYWRIIRFFI